MTLRILTGGRVLTMAGQTYDPGFVQIDGGKIVAVGALSDLPLRPPRPRWWI